MRISSFTVYGYSNGSIIVDLGESEHLSMTLTDEESAQLRIVAQRIVEKRQAALAAAVTQPFIALAHFTEA